MVRRTILNDDMDEESENFSGEEGMLGTSTSSALVETRGRAEPGQLQVGGTALAERRGRKGRSPETASDSKKRHRLWHVVLWHNCRTKLQVEEWFDENKDKISRCAACEDTNAAGEYHIHVVIAYKQPVSLENVKKQFCREAHCSWFDRNAWNNEVNYGLGEGADEEKNKRKKNFIKYNCKGYTARAGTRAAFYEEWAKEDTIGHAMQMWEQPQWKSQISEIDHIRKYIALKMSRIHERPDDKLRMRIWLHGGTRCGKSRWAHRFMKLYQEQTGKPAATIDISPSGQVSQLNGDEGCVLLDDVKLGTIDNQRFLNLIDTYPMTIDVKGSTAHYDPDVVIVTCIEHPTQIDQKWAKWKDDVKQVAMRITHLIGVTIDHKYEFNGKEYEFDQLMEIALQFVKDTF